jgi:hypothetical protein
MASTVLHIRVSDRDLALLQERAEALGLPVATCARQLLSEGLRGGSSTQAAAILDALEENAKLRYRLSRILLLLPQEPD